MDEERWVLARGPEEGIEAFGFVGTPDEVRAYQLQWPFTSDDYKVYRLVEVRPMTRQEAAETLKFAIHTGGDTVPRPDCPDDIKRAVAVLLGVLGDEGA